MRADVFLSLFLRQVAVSLALLCLTAQALVPDGYMIGRPADGMPPTIVLCTGGGPLTLDAMDLTVTSADHGEDKAADHPPCVFAASFVATAPDMTPTLAAPPQQAEIRVRPATGRTRLAIGPNAPPPARGPPAIV